MKFILRVALFSAAFAFIFRGADASMAVPRYPGALYSPWQKFEAEEISLNKQFFSSKDSVSKIAYFYKARLFSSGWQEAAGEKHSPGIFTFQRPGHQIQLALWRDRKNLVTYVELTHTAFFPKAKRGQGDRFLDVLSYPASKKVLSMEGEGGNTLVLAYTSTASLPQVYYYYRAHMERLGWKYNSSSGLLAQKSSERVLMFEGEAKECMVSICENRGAGGTTIFVLYRKGQACGEKFKID